MGTHLFAIVVSLAVSVRGILSSNVTLGPYETARITSPSYPNNYGNNLNIIWVIQTVEHWRIHVIASSFNTESSYDPLRGGDGTDSANSTTAIFVSSGSRGPDAVSNGPVMWLRFTSDYIISSSGFILWAVSVPSQSSLDFNCTFEDGLCGWTQSTDDDSNWTLDSGGTPSSDTGPSIDKTIGSTIGTYCYYEATGRSEGDRAVLVSPVVARDIGRSPSNFCFSFWYSMYGLSMGTLNVYGVPINGSIDDGEVVFTRSGQQTTSSRTWLFQSICLSGPAPRFKVAFEAVRGSGYTSDIAIDDLVASVFSSVTVLFWDSTTIFPPVGGISHIVEGEDQSFLCQVVDLQQGASFRWTVDYQEVTPDRSSSLRDNSGLYTSTSVLTLPVITSARHGKVVQCHAQPTNQYPLSTVATIYVKVPPKQSNLSLYDSDGILGVSVSVVEGAPKAFFCTVKLTRPAATIQWLLNEANQMTDTPPSGGSDGLMDTTSSWTLVPSRANHGQRVKCVASTPESESPLPSVTVTLDVEGPPDTPSITGSQEMTENELAQLVCQADLGYPNDWGLVWSTGGLPAQGSLTTAVTTSGNRFKFTSTLNFQPARTNNGDMITCSVARGSLTQGLTETFGPINVKYPPYFSDLETPRTVSEGDDVMFTCRADANPKPARFITWEKVGSPNTLSSVYSNGSSSLALLNISREQAGRYRCRGDNGVPPVVYSSQINVTVRFKPRPPMDILIQQGGLTSDSLTIAWTPTNDGGEEQWFYVNHRELESTADFDPATRSIRLYNVSMFTVVGLHPDTAYEVEVYAENANGVSGAVKTVGTTKRSSLAHLGYIAGMSVEALILLLSIITNLVLCWKWRITTKQEKQQRASERRAKTGASPRVVEVTEDYEIMSIPMRTIQAKTAAVAESTYDNIAESQVTISRDQLTFVRELRQGAFRKLLLAKAEGIELPGVATPVVVKTTQDENDPSEKESLMQELMSMKALTSHANIARLLGYCVDKDPVYVIVENVAHGTLKELLTEYADQSEQVYDNLGGAANIPLTPRTLLSMAKDVAEGMAFLASNTCLHKDLESCNVFVGEEMVCKLLDFGYAKDVAHLRKHQHQNQGLVPLRWMALESVLDDVYTTKSDVWSFGILLWEMITLGARPYPALNAKKVVTKVKSGYRMPHPSHCHVQLYQLMLECWAKNPEARPTFATVSETLEGLMGKANEYIAFESYQAHLFKTAVSGGSDYEKI
ncbi:macrophage colony-stimulating factor 1 receptor-like isoform X2 [Acanthaster planci]|uniref:Macrophage colony-stimulating factor 1 receptor-like isoform X2 n=1 Tax=Acanthaster planci TaxID=133434 RepID=A0A8B7ZUK4_ACAPL|nr:macrophage colony-stimulating factor 1 receptor-like isoform X2 [Acanthaster planci]